MLLVGVQDNPAISASARRRVARGREYRRAILQICGFAGRAAPQPYSLSPQGWAARPPVPQSRRWAVCPSRARKGNGLWRSKYGG
nr:MAG TPA: hypothetical protein [Caudoviricetes sp.]